MLSLDSQPFDVKSCQVCTSENVLSILCSDSKFIWTKEKVKMSQTVYGAWLKFSFSISFNKTILDLAPHSSMRSVEAVLCGGWATEQEPGFKTRLPHLVSGLLNLPVKRAY